MNSFTWLMRDKITLCQPNGTKGNLQIPAYEVSWAPEEMFAEEGT